MVTKANFHDINALKNTTFIKNIHGKLVGDKGYINCGVKERLLDKSIELIYKERNNMDPYLNKIFKDIFNKRKAIEGVFSYIKNRIKAIRSLSRSITSFLVHIKAALVCYSLGLPLRKGHALQLHLLNMTRKPHAFQSWG
jgi:hypothetical protein